uniref:uncharacterized protein wu:fi75a02 isoform X2 n=1 Tax=Doryrhamphus excisus TaxID=161450 RepID=UPI0025AEC43D|nr:uncharacterized protein wu:fi75a02 isoform X2 [Doryrhamphus excisus]
MPAVTPPPAFPLADSDVAGGAQTSPPATNPVLCHHPCPSCACASLLPRLLAAHRMEMRRLLRGAVTSLGRRLDALERRSGRRTQKRSGRPTEDDRGGGATNYPHVAASSSFPGLLVSSCSPALLSASSHNPLLSWTSSQSEQRGGGEKRKGRKRRRSHRRERGVVGVASEKSEEDAGRFVGRMVLCRSGGGANAEAPLMLMDFDRRGQKERREGGGVQSVEAMDIVARRNGCSTSFHFLRSSGSSSQWRFSDFTPPPALCSNHRPLPVPASFSPAPLLRLFAVAAVVTSVRGGTCWNPWRCLRDWTAPPSLSIDHCYMRPSADLRHTKRRDCLLAVRPAPSSPHVAPAPLPAGQSAGGSKEKGRRVSQIPIRRASPRETPLTPMGLPKVKRVKKNDFSVEEIYTNKNYKSPSINRSLETIFEEPREKDGALLLIGQRRRRRLLLFPDFTQPRKRKRPQGFPVMATPRKRATARRHYHVPGGADEASDLDVMLVERLSALEDFLTRQGSDV